MEIIGLVTIFFLAVIEIWIAIPAGLALGVHPVVIGITVSMGAIIGVLIVSTVGENIRKWLLQHYGEIKAEITCPKCGHTFKHKKEEIGLLYRIWNLYGSIGLGLLPPLIFGAPLGAAVGIALGAPKGRLLFWMSIGILLWSAGLTIAIAKGCSILGL